MAYVKTKFCEIEESEIYELENYAKKCGIKYSKWYKEDWNYGDTEENLARLNDIRKRALNRINIF